MAFGNKSIGRGVMAVVSYFATSMVWLTAGVEMWESGLALHNGCQLWYCRLMSGQDYGDETKTRTNTPDSVEKGRRCGGFVVVVTVSGISHMGDSL